MSSLASLLKRLPTEGFYNLPLPGTITLSGDDAKTFLQGQLTCNLEDISPTQSRLGAYCDIKGRVVGLFRVIQIDQYYHLVMDPEIIDIVAKTLRRYAVFSRVTLDTAPVFSQRIGIIGHSALNLPQQLDEVYTRDGQTIVKVPGAQPRWEILVPSSATPITEQPLQDPAAWEAHNILCGLPTLKANTSGQFTTHKLGLIQLQAVSFNKGCYLGQEIVARTQYLGTQKGGLYWAAIEPPFSFPPKTEIHDVQQQLIGNIINCTTIDNFTLILAALKQAPHQDDQYFITNTRVSLMTPFTQPL